MVHRWVPHIFQADTGIVYAECGYSRVRWRVKARGWGTWEAGCFQPLYTKPKS